MEGRKFGVRRIRKCQLALFFWRTASKPPPDRRMEIIPPIRIHVGIFRSREIEDYISAGDSPDFSSSCCGAVSFDSRRRGNSSTSSLFGSTVRSSLFAPRFGRRRGVLNLLTADSIEAVLSLDLRDRASAQIQNWWPVTTAEWTASDAVGFWEPGEIIRGFPMLSELPRIPHSQLRRNISPLHRTQSLFPSPARFGDAAETYVRDSAAGGPPPPFPFGRLKF